MDLAIEYNVNSIPRVMVFKGNRKPLGQRVGLVSDQELAKLLDQALQA